MVSTGMCIVALMALVLIGLIVVVALQITMISEGAKLVGAISPQVAKILEDPDTYLAERLEATLPEIAQKMLRATMLGMAHGATAGAAAVSPPSTPGELAADQRPHTFKTRDCNMNNAQMCSAFKTTCTHFWACQLARDIQTCLPLIDDIDNVCTHHTSAMYKNPQTFAQVNRVCARRALAMTSLPAAQQEERDMTQLCAQL